MEVAGRPKQPKLSSGTHFGARLVFDGDGYLFITLGENNQRSTAQDLDKLQGKVVRLHADGRVPADNPFVGQAGARGKYGPTAIATPRARRSTPEPGSCGPMSTAPAAAMRSISLWPARTMAGPSPPMG